MILALDLARTAGYAFGRPGDTPSHGRVQLASPGSSHEACFLAAHKWMDTTIQWVKPTTIVWEAPLPTSFRRGATNVDTTTLLFGLPAVIGLTAFLHGIYDCRKADAGDVRRHFIGWSPKRAMAKVQTKQRCRMLGWEVRDDNEADALAIWHYMCSLIDPKIATKLTPMFGRKSA